MRRVISTEESIWGFVHFFRGYTETHQCVINDSIVLKGPEIMELLLGKIFMRRKSKNTIGVVSKTLRFVKSQELEISTFIVLQLHLKLDEGGLAGVV